MAAGQPGWGEHQPAVARHEAAAGGGLQFFPDRVGAQDERYKLAAFADGLPGNARLAVRGTLVVRGREPVDPYNLRSELRRLVQRRTTHSAQSNHNNVRYECHARHDDTTK